MIRIIAIATVWALTLTDGVKKRQQAVRARNNDDGWGLAEVIGFLGLAAIATALIVVLSAAVARRSAGL